MVERVQELAQSGGGRIDADTVVSPGSWDAALLAAGAAVEATRLVLEGEAESAFALVRPPGHHATPDRSMGFCLVNNVAVAAEWALDDGGARRVAIFDPDVHHGNGTQDCFYDRGEVLYASIHQSPLYPGTGFPEECGTGDGEGFTLNLPVPAGTGEPGYRALVHGFVLPVLRAFDPDLLLVSAGFDAHVRDPIGGLRLGSGFYGDLFTDLLDTCPRLVACLEGGYDLTGLGEGVAHAAAALAGRPLPRVAAPAAAPLPSSLAGSFRRTFGRFWGLPETAETPAGDNS